MSKTTRVRPRKFTHTETEMLSYLMSGVSFVLMVAVFCISPLAAAPAQAQSAQLSEAQIGAIVNLLDSFGAEASVRQNVESALRGGSPSAEPAPAAPQEPESAILGESNESIAANSAASQGEFRVDDYGGKPDGITDSTVALQKAINAAVASKQAVRVVFSSGTYLLSCAGFTEKNCITISNANGLSVLGKGSGQTQLMVGNPRTGVFYVVGSKGVTFSDFSLDFNPVPAAQATITHVNWSGGGGSGSVGGRGGDSGGTGASGMRVRIDPGSPALDDPVVFPSGMSSFGHSFGMVFDASGVVKSPNNLQGLSFSPLGQNEFLIHGVSSSNSFQAGDKFVYPVRNYRPTFYFRDSSNLQILSVTQYASPDAALQFLGNSGTVLIDNYQLRRKSGRILTSSGDALYAPNNTAKFTVRNSHFEGMGDDVANWHARADKNFDPAWASPGSEYINNRIGTFRGIFRNHSARSLIKDNVFVSGDNGRFLVADDAGPTWHEGPGLEGATLPIFVNNKAGGEQVRYVSPNFKDSWPVTESPAPVTVPLAPVSPAPASGASGQPYPSLTLQWKNGGNAQRYALYVGTSMKSLTLRSVQSGLSYSLSGLSPSTPYYWRVDAANSAGTTTGQMWNFTTIKGTSTTPVPDPKPAPDSLTASPQSGTAPLTVSFGGSVRSSGYSIDFGDGTPVFSYGCAHGACAYSGATKISASHAYAKPGTYTAKLRRHFFKNEANCAGVDCNVVARTVITVVRGASPVPIPDPKPAPDSLTASPLSGIAPLTVAFGGSVRSSGYTIDFGDGTAPFSYGCAHGACTSAGPTKVSASHAYAKGGSYTVKLRRHFLNNEANCAGVDCTVVAQVAVTVKGASVVPLPVPKPVSVLTEPLYRFRDSRNHATARTAPASDWINEGVLGYIATQPGTGLVALRQCLNKYNRGIDYVASVTACDKGMEDTGVIGYVWTTAANDRKPIYRCYRVTDDIPDHYNVAQNVCGGGGELENGGNPQFYVAKSKTASANPADSALISGLSLVAGVAASTVRAPFDAAVAALTDLFVYAGIGQPY